MFVTRAVTLESLKMPRSAVSRMLCESINGEPAVQLVHEAIACYLRDDRCSRDAKAERITVDQSGLGSGVLREKGIAKQAIYFEGKVVYCALEGNAVGRSKPKQINLVGFDNSHCHRYRGLTNVSEGCRSLA
jgi:hypothetical protein